MTTDLSLSYDQARELVDDLWSWSQNYEFPTPASLFLDLIGYSEDEYGERLCADRMPSLGYKEHDLLGRALVAYSDRPGAVLDRVAELIADELEGN